MRCKVFLQTSSIGAAEPTIGQRDKGRISHTPNGRAGGAGRGSGASRRPPRLGSGRDDLRTAPTPAWRHADTTVAPRAPVIRPRTATIAAKRRTALSELRRLRDEGAIDDVQFAEYRDELPAREGAARAS